MQDQMMLFDSAPREKGENALFAVFLMAPEVSVRLSATAETIQKEHGLFGKLRPLNHLHVTVYRFGEFKEILEDDVVRASKACAGGAASLQSFDAVFDEVVTYRNSGALAANCHQAKPQLLKLQRFIGSGFYPGKRSGDDQGKSPHVTLSYVRGSFAGQAIDPIPWRADELTLIHSVQGKTEYRILGRWPLAVSLAGEGIE